MERPESIFGLTAHLVRLRWQALSPRGRVAAIATAAVLGLATAATGAHVAMGHACCAQHCAARAAAHGCPHAHGH